MTSFENEPMLEIYIYETSTFLDQMEQVIINSEKEEKLSDEAINEIFRFMHTIKGSSAMMLFNNIATLAHQLEDLFYFIRETKPKVISFSTLSDLALEVVDFIKVEVNKIKNRDEPDGDSSEIVKALVALLEEMKLNNNIESEIKKPESDKVQQYYIPQEKKHLKDPISYYKATIRFESGCEMENIRAYTVIFGLTDLVEDMVHFPPDVAENEKTTDWIRENGFEIRVKTKLSLDEIQAHLDKTVFLETLEVVEILESEFKLEQEEKTIERIQTEPQIIKVPIVKTVTEEVKEAKDTREAKESKEQKEVKDTGSTMISVNVDKLDNLMNTVGELVIAEAMVTQNPIVASIDSDSFQKSSRLLHKITGELQDMVMSIRMVSLSTTFVKMHRIVRDMSKKLNKEVILDLFGEETEVDKNIIEKISDPLMHLIRNAIDHGIESEEERLEAGKEKTGRITLGAKNVGSDVLIIVKDDGKGLNREKILEKAKAQGMLSHVTSDMSDREIFNLILLPGFSTKEAVTEFSGRGVGMDVVAKNIEAVGGSIVVESEEGIGTTMTLKIPLTLAIIEGMNIRVGDSRFTIPITAIKESFRPEKRDIIIDPDKNEMVMVRGDCFPIMRLHNRYKIPSEFKKFEQGILIMVEQDDRVMCLFADELMGQQQVVVKALPSFISNIKKIDGLAGCTLLGDGSISLILDISSITGLRIR